MAAAGGPATTLIDQIDAAPREVPDSILDVLRILESVRASSTSAASIVSTSSNVLLKSLLPSRPPSPNAARDELRVLDKGGQEDT